MGHGYDVVAVLATAEPWADGGVRRPSKGNRGGRVSKEGIESGGVMSEELEVAEKSKFKRKARAVPRAASTEVNPVSAEIAKNIAELLKDRAEASRNVSKLMYWQDRERRVTAEIHELIGFQQRLTPGASPVPPAVPAMGAFPPGTAGAPGGWAAWSGVPAGVGSIPAKQPASTSGNVAEEVGGEGGFA